MWKVQFLLSYLRRHYCCWYCYHRHSHLLFPGFHGLWPLQLPLLIQPKLLTSTQPGNRALFFLPAHHHDTTTIGIFLSELSLSRDGIKQKCNTSCRPYCNDGGQVATQRRRLLFETSVPSLYQVSAMPNNGLHVVLDLEDEVENAMEHDRLPLRFWMLPILAGDCELHHSYRYWRLLTVSPSSPAKRQSSMLLMRPPL